MSGEAGRQWRSLEERAAVDGAALEALVESKWPSRLGELIDPVRRREFLQLMGASIGLAGLAGCTRQPKEPILPYARHPETTIPGRPRFFATAFSLSGESQGVLVESHEGRPTKVEGNPDHSASRGATCAMAQASVLGLYDPDRSQVVLKRGRIDTWEQFAREVGPRLKALRAQQGRGLALLSETVVSPTLGAQMDALRAAFPEARWFQYEPVNRDAERAAALEGFGEDVVSVPLLERAEVVLALDADPLGRGISATRYGSDFGMRRRAALAGDGDCRWYAVEASPTVTGSIADHRFPVRPSEVEGIARALLERLAPGTIAGDVKVDGPAWLEAAAKDLAAHRGRAAIVVGAEQPAIVHRLAQLANEALDAYGQTIELRAPAAEHSVDHEGSLTELVEAMEAGAVTCFVALEGNPVYSAPRRFRDALEHVPLRVHHGLYEDETARQCHWHLPATHSLEQWSDARSADGTVALVQPLIAPLYDGRSVHEIVAFLAGAAFAPGGGYDLVRATWQAHFGADGFEAGWRRALHDGVIAGTERPQRELTPTAEGLTTAPVQAGVGLELALRPDPTIWDGRFANNGWLQELPKPVTLTTWDNLALIAPATAERLGVAAGDEVELSTSDGSGSVRLAAWIVPGHPAESVTAHLGYGRTRSGSTGTRAGTDVGPLRELGASRLQGHLTLERTGERRAVACVQDHHSMEGRDLVRVETLAAARLAAQPAHAEQPQANGAGEHGNGRGEDAGHGTGHHVSLIDNDDHAHDGHAWGMVIDLGSCLGCNACVIACQAENNVPVVGRDEVLNGREMHWLRVDRYWEGEPENPRTLYQPVPCMHCENAPCEVVCPVAATTHSAEGLNEMTYNRCVGTRYCSNNCPYKVRRFNFFQYADYDTESLKMLHNPDVTVRFRGVMEKCTYCVQRINQARIAGKRSGEGVQDGDVVTACQGVCPTRAITFGDLADPNSDAARKRASQRNYGLLEELNTKPRTTYLPTWTDPHPELT